MISDEIADVFYELEKYEKKVNHKETRRHTSLQMLEDEGFEFADPEADIDTAWEKQEQAELEEEIEQIEEDRLARVSGSIPFVMYQKRTAKRLFFLVLPAGIEPTTNP